MMRKNTMKGKILATTLCITGLAIVSLPVGHADASCTAQYFGSNGCTANKDRPVVVSVSLPTNHTASGTDTYLLNYYKEYLKGLQKTASGTTTSNQNTGSQTKPTGNTGSNQNTGSQTKPSGNTSSNQNNGSSKTDYSVSQDETYMLQLINGEREKAGLSDLTMDASLANLARLKSQDMLTNNYFSHESPTYGSPFDMMKNNGISYQMAGENIAKNSSVYSAHVAFMNSEGHRANILNSSFNKAGIGIVKGSNNTYIITEMFIKQ